MGRKRSSLRCENGSGGSPLRLSEREGYLLDLLGGDRDFVAIIKWLIEHFGDEPDVMLVERANQGFSSTLKGASISLGAVTTKMADHFRKRRSMKNLLCLFALFPAVANAETLTWDPPTHYEAAPGATPAPLPTGAIKEYRLYDKRKFVRAVPAPTVSTSVIILSGRTYAWEVTAVDQSGRESTYSNSVVWYPTPVPTLQWPPAEPGNLTLGK